MHIDRRNPERARAGRRRARRALMFENVTWCLLDEDCAHRGVVVGASRAGLALITQHADTPPLGAYIAPRPRQRRDPWHKPARVTRIEPLSSDLDLVAGDYQLCRLMKCPAPQP